GLARLTQARLLDGVPDDRARKYQPSTPTVTMAPAMKRMSVVRTKACVSSTLLGNASWGHALSGQRFSRSLIFPSVMTPNTDAVTRVAAPMPATMSGAMGVGRSVRADSVGPSGLGRL